MPNCCSKGLSKPYWALTEAMDSGVAFSPSRARAGSPGSARTQTNSSTISPSSTGIISRMRRTTNLSTVTCLLLRGVGDSQTFDTLRGGTCVEVPPRRVSRSRQRVTLTVFQTSSCTGLAT